MESPPRVKFGIDFNTATNYLLRLNPEEVAQNTLEIPISGPITKEGLKKLSLLKFEIIITRIDGKLIISTGDKLNALHDHNYEVRLRTLNAKSTIHLHPIGEDGLVADAPSAGDWRFFKYRNERIREQGKDYIFHTNGILVFEISIHHSQEKEIEFYKNNGIALGKFVQDEFPNLALVSEISLNKRVELARKFSIENNYIKKEISWDSIEIDGFIDEINSSL